MKKVVMLGPCAERIPKDGVSWDAGDPIIQEGVFKLLPQLENCEIIQSIFIDVNDIEKTVKEADYFVTPGTPSWVNPRYRLWWKEISKQQKKVSFLGIGLTVPFAGNFWYGHEDFINLKDSGAIDLIVCRDKFCYYWLHKVCGVPDSYINELPCPGFYTLPIKARTSKKRVVFSLPNPEETSVGDFTVFERVLEKCAYIIDELEKRGAQVFLSYQRHLPSFPVFAEEVKRIMPNRKLYWFPLWQDFENFHKDKDVYIGFRNHGALPCAGAGMPSLLIGTDYRQILAEEIPFLSKYDVSHTNIKPSFIADWYYALNPESISSSLITWRGVTLDKWQHLLTKINQRLQ